MSTLWKRVRTSNSEPDLTAGRYKPEPIKCRSDQGRPAIEPQELLEFARYEEDVLLRAANMQRLHQWLADTVRQTAATNAAETLLQLRHHNGCRYE